MIGVLNAYVTKICVFTGYEKFSKLSFLTKLYGINCNREAINACMSDIFDLIADIFYIINTQITPSFYEARRSSQRWD